MKNIIAFKTLLAVSFILLVAASHSVLVVPLHAQYSAGAQKIEAATKLYDERGFSTAKKNTWVNNLVISNANGNPAYTMVLSDYQEKGYPVKSTLTYNGNVSHSTYNVVRDALTSANPWDKFSENRPAWIIGVNGFAVQVLSNAELFASKPYVWNGQMTGNYVVSKDNPYRPQIWMIQGYNYCNSMYSPCNVAANAGGAAVDYIHLLKADGGLLSLARVTPASTVKDTNRYKQIHTGYYYPVEQNSKGYAVVTAKWIQCKDAKGNNRILRPRTVHYYPGDGLEYVFEEKLLPYGLDFDDNWNGLYTITGTNDPHPWYLSGDHDLYGFPTVKPSIFYLAQISCASGVVASCLYSRHEDLIPTDYDGNLIDTTRGRALFRSGGGIKLDLSDGYMAIETIDGVYHLNYKTQKGSLEGFSNNQMIFRDAVESNFDAPSPVTDMTTSEYFNYSYQGLITSITDPAGRRYAFEYEPKRRLYSRMYPDYLPPDMSEGTQGTNDPPRFTATVSYRLKHIWEPGKHTRLDYMAYNECEHWTNRSYTSSTDTIADKWDQNLVRNDPYFKDIVRKVWEYNNADTLYKLKVLGMGSNYLTTANPERYFVYDTTYDYTSTAQKISYSRTEFEARKVATLPGVFISAAGDSTGITNTVEEFSITNSSASDPQSKVQTEYQRFNNLTWLPIVRRQYIKTGNNWLLQSFSKCGYRKINNVRQYGADLSGATAIDALLRDSLGYDIQQDTSYTMFPSDTTAPYIYTINDYEHFPLQTVTASSGNDPWDYNTILGIRQENSTSSTWGNKYEKVLSNTNVAELHSNITWTVNIPPIWGVLKKSQTFDAQNSLLIGKEMNFVDLTNAPAKHPRSLASSVKLLLPNNQSLKTDSTIWHSHTNLPYALVSPQGSRSYAYYSLEKHPLFESNQNERKITAKVLYNDNTTANTDFYPVTEYSMLYKTPVAAESIIRYWDAANSRIDTLRYSMFRRVGRYGTTEMLRDANGWFTRTEFDGLGRLRQLNMPGDFEPPSNPETNISIVEGTRTYPYYYISGGTEYQKKKTCVYCTTCTPQHYKEQQDPGYYATYPLEETYSGLVGRITYPDLPLNDPCQKPSTIYTSKIEHTLQLKPFVRETDMEIHEADSVFLELTITGVEGSMCNGIHIHAEDFSYDQDFMFNCNGGNDPTFAVGVMRINLTSYVQQQIQGNRPYFNFTITPLGSSIAVNFGVPNAGEYLDAQSIAPRIVVKGSFLRHGILGDYTLQYNYRDADPGYAQDTSSWHLADYLSIFTQAKVDDIAHSSNGAWEILDSWSQYYREGKRHTWTQNIFGYEYGLKKSRNGSGNQLRNNATLNVLDSLSFNFNAKGKVLKATDQIGKSSTSTYSAAGLGLSSTHPDNSSTATVYHYRLPSGFPELADQDFHGLANRIINIDEVGKATAIYTDGIGQKRREVSDFDTTSTDPARNLITRYEYDIQGRLIMVTNPQGQKTRYWYDALGRVKYKHNTDVGYTSYSYDNDGNVRFSQNQQQANDSKMLFTEYDDMHRPTLIGEAAFQPQTVNESAPGSGLPNPTLNLNRLTDNLPGTRLYNNYNDPVTVNRTLYSSSYYAPTFDYGTFNDCLPDVVPGKGALVASALSQLDCQYQPMQPVLQHPVGYWDNAQPASLPGADPEATRFENMELYPEFARMVICYDTLPQRVSNGLTTNYRSPFWKGMPIPTYLNALCPKGSVRNQKGRIAAVGYRSKGGEPFHYVVYSYDERGRVEAMLRWTENIGMDAIYYQYNSMNAVRSVTVADAWRQHTTWYGYDWAGRVDTIWTAIGSNGSGVSYGYGSYPSTPLTKPATADIAYSYNKRGQVERAYYLNAIGTDYVQSKYYYNANRAWLDSLIVGNAMAQSIREGVFGQALYYKANGLVDSLSYMNNGGSYTTQRFSYDNVQRLASWDMGFGTSPTAYNYDKVGNRLSQSVGGSTTHSYTYPSATINSNRLLRVTDQFTQHWTDYGYNANGAMVQRSKQAPPFGDPPMMLPPEVEDFYYEYRGLMERYVKNVEQQNYNCPDPTNNDPITPPMTYNGTQIDWRYRYNALGEREQKRLYYSPQSDSCANAHVWMYYLLDGDNRQLASYVGMQTVQATAQNRFNPQEWCTSSQRTVYFWAGEYNSYSGSNVAVRYSSKGGNWQKEYPFTDHLGSTRVTLSPTTANVVSSYNYEPFGKIITGVSNDRTDWIGKEKDKENSLRDLGARKYDEDLGRFMSIDPLWEKYNAWNPYHYSLNNPLLFLDKGGMDVFLAFSGANWRGEEATEVAGNLVNRILTYAQDHQIEDVSALAIPTDVWHLGVSMQNGLDFIRLNYTEGEKLIVYGYSKGGEAATRLMTELNAAGIKVDVLFLVDAAAGSDNDKVPRTIPSNVVVVENFFQTTADITGSRGQPVTPAAQGWHPPMLPPPPRIVNHVLPDESHTSIDEATENDIGGRIENIISD